LANNACSRPPPLDGIKQLDMMPEYGRRRGRSTAGVTLGKPSARIDDAHRLSRELPIAPRGAMPMFSREAAARQNHDRSGERDA